MNEHSWRRLNQLYHAAAELRPSDRAVFLNHECAGDAGLHAELDSLFSASDQAGDFLETPPTLSTFMEQEPEPDDETGRRIGPYEITGVIGHGGMGTVYKATRADDQYRKQVAIKLIKRGMDTDSMLRRFRRERQILASLEHPNIARLLDGGASEDGLPYFVMEHVEGESINRYADAHRLTLPQRIQLFRDVCSAVQYAHQNLVVHRDLKPSNILVTAEGAPKLLDFGIAKLLDPEFDDDTVEVTATGLRLMTPGYASPEQVRGKIITTASDVYSLGVLLYELLAGTRPLHLDGRDPSEVAQIICHEEPPKPSVVVHRPQKTEDAAILAEARATTLQRLSRSLSGDLDNIVLKVLAKDPLRRYSSAAHLSDDLRRYLDGLPVTARPDSWMYRSGKFVRRHRVSVVGAALLSLAVLAGIGATLWQARIAQVERARAERRFNDVRALAHSFLFESDDSIKNLEGTTAARELMVKRALQYLSSLAGEGGNDLTLQREIASAYDKVSDVQGNFRMANLGDQKGALESARKAVSIRESLAAMDEKNTLLTRELATSYQKLADLLWMMQQPQEALRIAGKQVAAAQAVYRAVPEDRDSRKLLASAYTEYGRLQDAANGDNRIFVENERKAVALLEPLVATDPQDRQARFLLARAYGFRANAMGDVTDKDAFVLFRKALEISKSLSDLEPRNAEYSKATAGAYNDLGGMLQEMRDLPGAMDNHLRALAVLDGMGASDPKNMQVRRDRATMLCVVGELTVKMGRTAASVPYLEKSVALFESLPAPPNMQVRWGKARVQYDLARAYSQSGNKTGANALYQQCIPEFKDMRSRGLLPALSAEFVDHALADMAKSKPAR